MQPLQEMLNAARDLCPAPLLLRQIFCLLFADDVALISMTAEGLQRQLDILQEFCDISSMAVNLDKTAVLIFKKGVAQDGGDSGLFWQGQQVPLSQQYKYMGMELYSTKTIHEARTARLQQATKAANLIQSRSLSQLACTARPLLKFLQTCVLPILLYACPRWVVGCPISAWPKLKMLQSRYLKRHLRLRDTTSTLALLAECGILPVEIEAMIATNQFVQQIMQMNPERLPALALRLSTEDADLGRQSWGAQYRVWLARWGLPAE